MDLNTVDSKELQIATEQAKEKMARIDKASKVKHNDKYLEMLIQEQLNINRFSTLTVSSYIGEI